MSPSYDAAVGFTVVPDLLSLQDVEAVTAEIRTLLALPHDQRDPRDKVASGTRHLFNLGERSPKIRELVETAALRAEVSAILGNATEQFEFSYRSPQPGFGAQKLHADDVPRVDVGGPADVATAIVALTDFTELNGATRVVPGSHLRPDLQRLSGTLDRHPDEIALLGAAGSGFIFSGHLLHSGTRNGSAAERPALQLVWRRVG